MIEETTVRHFNQLIKEGPRVRKRVLVVTPIPPPMGYSYWVLTFTPLTLAVSYRKPIDPALDPSPHHEVGS